MYITTGSLCIGSTGKTIKEKEILLQEGSLEQFATMNFTMHYFRVIWAMFYLFQTPKYKFFIIYDKWSE